MSALCPLGGLRPASLLLAFAGYWLLASAMNAPPACAQTEASSGYKLSNDMRARLLQRGDLTLRDATFVEAMFAIRKVWGANVVVGNDLKEETVSCEFIDTPLHEILDTILTPRGFAYRPIGNSLVVVKQEAIGAMKPLFESATIPVRFADPKEVKEAVSFYLSEQGQLQVVESAKRIIVIDYADRIETIKAKVRELDEAAKELGPTGMPLPDLAPSNGDNPPLISNLPALPQYNQKAAFFDLKHLKAETVAPALQPLLSPLGKISVVPKDNRLVVFDTPERLVLLHQALTELDVPRAQVRISALIYDAALEDIRKVGVNWNGTGFHGHNLDGSGIAQDAATLNAFTAAGAAAGASNGALAITSLGSSFDVRVVVQALAESKKSRLLADPNVTVYDNETAKIDIVTEIPYQQLTQSQQGGQIGTTAFREAGVSLQVTPQIGADDTITMDVNPRFSVLVGMTPDTDQPIIDRRETMTTVRIRNRETLVIGGLRQKNSINNRSGIPGLMNLHWPIGELFKQKDVTARDGELIVFITPEILDDCYLGRDREHDAYNASMPALDTIEPSRLPDDPCYVEEWKHRCGCKHCKKGGHEGPCQRVHRHTPPATQVYEPQEYRESLPPPAEVESRGPQPTPTSVREPANSARSPRLTTKTSATSPFGAPKVKSRSVTAKPMETAARSSAPAVAQTKRLPSIEQETPRTAQRLTPRDIFKLPPVGEPIRR